MSIINHAQQAIDIIPLLCVCWYIGFGLIFLEYSGFVDEQGEIMEKEGLSLENFCEFVSGFIMIVLCWLPIMIVSTWVYVRQEK